MTSISAFKMVLRRSGKVVALHPEGFNTNFAEVATLDANLRTMGYALDDNLAGYLMGLEVDAIAEYAKRILPVLAEAKGIRYYKGSFMYPNFPQQVMDMDESVLYINAIMHYFGDVLGIRVLPQSDTLERPELDFDEKKVTVLRLATANEASAFINSVFMMTAAWSQDIKDDLKSLTALDLSGAIVVEPTHLPNHENAAWFFVNIVASLRAKAVTATDVLRQAVAMSEGDVSLAEKTKFIRFSRAQRKALMTSLQYAGKSATALAEDMLRHEQAWKNLSRGIHAGDYATSHPIAFEAIRLVRSGEVQTFNSKVEKALKAGHQNVAAALLAERPGDFVRRLDHLLRIGNPSTVVSTFRTVAHEASPTVLVQARAAMLNRGAVDKRVFFPKGSVTKAVAIDDTRTPHGRENEIVKIIDNALTQVFGKRDRLGKVFIDPAFDSLTVPFGIRSASKALKTVGRGSRLAFDKDSKVLRFFIWWKDGQGRTDIDLSAVVLDENFNSKFDIAYYNLRELGGVHSGDITSAPNGASEFIDIDIEKVRKRGGRYVLMSVLSFSGQNFSDLPECFAGFMERKNAGSGEVYDPRTVTNRVDLAAQSRNGTPFMFDLETGEAIWLDLSQQFHASHGYGYNVASNKASLTETMEFMAKYRGPSLGHLIRLHAESRGEIVDAREDADYVFAPDGDFSPYDYERVLSELL